MLIQTTQPFANEKRIDRAGRRRIGVRRRQVFEELPQVRLVVADRVFGSVRAAQLGEEGVDVFGNQGQGILLPVLS